MKREPLSTPENFAANIAALETEIARAESMLARDPEMDRADMLHAAIYEASLYLAINRYSAGAAAEDIRPAVAKATQYFVSAVHHPTADNPAMKLTFYIYANCITLLSLNMLLGSPPAVYPALAGGFALLGNDRLIDTLLAAMLPGHAIGKKLLWPKSIGALQAVFEAPPRDRPALMEAYLAGWYKGMKKAIWHDAHKSPHGHPFFGYWSFESAAATRVLGIDDSSYRDLLFYPKDAATFAPLAATAI